MSFSDYQSVVDMFKAPKNPEVNLIVELMELQKNNPDEIIRQAIEAMATTIESEEEEKSYFLVFESLDAAMTLAKLLEVGSPAYQLYQTMAASAFDGRDDIFHQAYENYKERAEEMYELSLKDFDLAKKSFLSFCSGTKEKKQTRNWFRKRVNHNSTPNTEPLVCNHTFEGKSVVNGFGQCPICGECGLEVSKN